MAGVAAVHAKFSLLVILEGKFRGRRQGRDLIRDRGFGGEGGFAGGSVGGGSGSDSVVVRSCGTTPTVPGVAGEGEEPAGNAAGVEGDGLH